MTKRNLQVFIAHTDNDSDVAIAIQQWIHKIFSGGISVFCSSDQKSIQPGEEWRARIHGALKNADIILVICTQYSLSRPWVGYEAGAGWSAGAKVVPLCYHGITPSSLPEPFGIRQALDLGKAADEKRLLDLLVCDGGFDPKYITQLRLELPSRKLQEQDRGIEHPDLRVTVSSVAVYGRSGQAECFMCVNAANYSMQTVYLGGGFAFEQEGKEAILWCHTDALTKAPLYPRAVNPGDAVDILVDVAKFSVQRRKAIRRACFQDKIGRTYFSIAGEVERVIKDIERHI